MPVRVKVEAEVNEVSVVEEEDEDDEVMHDANNNNTADDDTCMNDGDDEDEDDDEIVREMDVFLSPQLVQHLHLLQFPLQPFPSNTNTNQQHNQQRPIAARFKPHHNMIELDQAIPARYIEHQGSKHIRERTFASHTVPVNTHLALGRIVWMDTTAATSTASASDDNDDDDDSDTPNKPKQLSLHLTPLHHMSQMRPTFRHIDEEDDDRLDTTAARALEEEKAAKQQDDKNKQGPKPLMFQKKESERAAIARKSSYAFKKSSEEGEEWISLKVCMGDENDNDNNMMDDDDEEQEDLAAEVATARRLMECPRECRHQFVLDVAATDNDHFEGDLAEDILADGGGGAGGIATTTGSSNVPSLVSYVRSLDYLPTVVATFDRAPAAASGSTSTSNQDNSGGADGGENLKYLLDWKQAGLDAQNVHIVVDLPTIGAHLTTLLCAGWPIPFSILRQSLPPTVPQQDILTALSSCAVMVRGNYCLQSRLLQLPKSVAKARTFILLLLQSMGIVHRSRLYAVLGITAQGDNNNINNNVRDNAVVHDEDLTPETILMLLEQVARKTPDGWVLKVQDDVKFLTRFPDNTKLYMEYWGRQMLRFQQYLQRYASVGY